MLPRGRKEALTQGAKRTQSEQGKNSQESRGCRRRNMAAAGFLSILCGKETRGAGPCRSFPILCFRRCIGRRSVACAQRRVFPATRKSRKLGAPAYAERLMPTGTYGGTGTYLWRGITRHAASKEK